MKIALINGGLANQTFQYIFMRYLEESTGQRVFVDDSFFFLTSKEMGGFPLSTHNGYEIERVFPNAKKPMLLSEHFPPDVWQYMIVKARASKNYLCGIAEQLLENGIDLEMIIECEVNDGVVAEAFRYTGRKRTTPRSFFNSGVSGVQGAAFYYGYWINPAWFNAYKEILLSELSFAPIADTRNKEYEREIRESYAIGIHIRRGDFVKLGWAVPERQYADTIAKLKLEVAKTPNVKYFVFSDDIDWCKNNAQGLGLAFDITTFVEGNFDYQNNYVDMQLMTMCNALVLGVSSFSYLASLLNQEPNFIALMGRYDGLSTQDIAKKPQ